VTVNLATGKGLLSHAKGDTYDSIENVTGSRFADTLIGNSQANVLDGSGGADILTGGGGADIFRIQKGEANDIITDFSSDDTVQLSGFGVTSFAQLRSQMTERNGSTVIDLLGGIPVLRRPQ
jgi:Ca2+-binding RTX toxin-like protein